MSTPPLSPSARSPTNTTPSPVSRRKLSRTEHPKPNESWFLILVNAFKSNFEQTLTYRESELYAWIMQAYPYYRHDMHTMQTSVKTTLSSYECFRQNGRSTWTFIPRRALVHLESLKSEEGREDSDYSGEEEEEMDDIEDEETPERIHDTDNAGTRYNHSGAFHHHDSYDHHASGSDSRIRYIDKHVDLMDEDSPTLSVEEILRFKQEYSGPQARKLKRKASGGHPGRPRARSPPDGLQDECSMSMEAWCNLLVQMFEASPKQKTIREIFAWVHDNYPIYRDAPGDAWQKDLTAALESNPLFKAMGRGRWQMVTQAPQPMIVVNGTTMASGSGNGGTVSNPSVKAEDDATDSPSVTEDEDWKAIGSKRLLNPPFRRYSIATDTVPKGHYKAGSTTNANSITTAGGSTTTVTASSSSSTLHASTSGGKLVSIEYPPGTYTATGRRFSSYHQPTPKNSPLLSATTAGLNAVPDLSLQITNTMTDETDDEDPTRRYMAPLQSAINSAVLALQSQQPLPQSQQQPKANPDPSVQGTLSNGQHHRPQQEQPKQYQLKELNHKGSTAEATTTTIVAIAATDTPTLQTSTENTTEIIPNGEDLASDQMDAIQALALLCGGGV